MSSDQRSERESDSGHRNAGRSDLSNADDLINSLVARFEAQWDTGSAPSVDEFLAAVNEADRSRLQLELAVVEWVRRQKRGDPDIEGQMRQRFPGLPLDAFLSLPGSIVESRDRQDRAEQFETVSMVGFGVPAPLRCPHCGNSVDDDGELTGDRICSSCGQPFFIESEPATPKKLGKQLGRFILQGRIGRGGFGTVYKALDPQLERIVALKLPRSDLLDPVEERRFLDEARSGATLHHPNIVAVHDVGFAGETPYIVSDYIEGETLDSLIRSRRLSFRDSAALIRDVARAIDYAHTKGIIHRDVKPSNIMVNTQGRPYIMDFGLARRDRLQVGVTIDGDILGTPDFMSPEQAMGKSAEVDARTDVYALGAVLYVLLTGERPFRGNPRMVMAQVLNDRPRSIRRLNDRVPRDLETICDKAMQKLPGWRYQSAQELADDLDRFLTNRPITARATTSVQRLWLWARRNPNVASLSAAILLLVVGTLVASLIASVSFSNLAQSRQQINLQMQVEVSRNRAIIGVERLSRGEPIGLLDLLQSCEPVERLTSELESRLLLARHWHEFLPDYLHAVVGHDYPVHVMAVSPDGKYFATGDSEAHLRIWEVETGLPKTDELTIEGTFHPIHMQFSPDGRSLYVAFGPHNKAILWQWTSGEIQSSQITITTHASPFDFESGELLGVNREIYEESGLQVAQFHRCQPFDSPSIEYFLPPLTDLLIVAFQPIGGYLAFGFGQGHLEVYGVNEQTLVWRDRQIAEVDTDTSFALDPLGEWLAVAYDDYSARLFRIKDGAPWEGQLQHQEDIKQMAFSPDGKRFASASFDSTVQIASLDEPNAPTIELRHDGPVLQLAFSPDGRWLATGGFDEQVRVWDAESGRLLYGPMKHYGVISGLAFHPSEAMLLSGSQDGSARWWRLKEDLEANRTLAHSGRVWSVDFSPSGEQLACATESGFVYLWDLADPASKPRRLNHSGPVITARYDPVGEFVWSTNLGTLAVWPADADDGASPVIEKQDRIRTLQFSPSGDWIVGGGGDVFHALWIGLSPQGMRSPAAAAPWDSQVVEHPCYSWDAAIHPSGEYFVTAGSDGWLRLFDTATRDVRKKLKAQEGSLEAVAFNLSGSELAGGGRGLTVSRWDTRTWTKIEPEIQVNSYVQKIAYSNDSRLIAVALANGEIRLYDPVTGLNCGPPLRHGFWATCVQFSPDDCWLASGSFDRTARILKLPHRPTGSDYQQLKRQIHVALGARLNESGVPTAIPWREWRSLRDEPAGDAAISVPAQSLAAAEAQ